MSHDRLLYDQALARNMSRHGTSEDAEILGLAYELLMNLNIPSSGLLELNDQLIKLNRLLSRILDGQPEPPQSGKWFFTGDRPWPQEKARLEPWRLVIHNIIQRRTILRDVYAARARPFLRRIQLLHMGDPILQRILSHLEPSDLDDDAVCSLNLKMDSSVTIAKSLRLTCRRLYNLASPMLLRTFTVNLTTVNLGRLRELPYCPHFRSGIKRIRLLVPFYARDLAEDYDNFVEYQDQIADSIAERLEEARGSELASPSNSDLKKLNALIKDMNYQADNQQFTKLRWEAYRASYLEQKRILNDPRFPSQLADILALLPNMTRLEIFDKPLHNGHLTSLEWRSLSLNDLARNHRLAAGHPLPHSWEYYWHLGPNITNDTTAFVKNVLVSLGSRGVRLTRLQIQVSSPRTYSPLQCSRKSASHLKRLVQGLNYFQYREYTDFPARASGSITLRSCDHLSSFGSFLNPLLDSPSLKQVHLELRNFNETGNCLQSDLNTLLATHSWPQLKSLFICGVKLSAADFGEFLKGRGIKLGLSYSIMVNGLWCELFNAMREMTDSRQPPETRLEVTTLHHLFGGECRWLPRKDRAKLFDSNHGVHVGKYNKKLSLVHAYVMHSGDVTKNPIPPWWKAGREKGPCLCMTERTASSE